MHISSFAPTLFVRMSTLEPTTPPRAGRQQGLILVGAMAALMWVVEVIDQVFSSAHIEQYGIRPHDAPDGLLGIISAPFLHAGFGHLIGNTVPFVVLGATIALSGFARVVGATLIVAIVGGLGVWLFAPAGTDHIGASGIVFGYATYLIARGLFSRNLLHLSVGIVVIAVYGTTLLFGLAPRDGISWQGHLFGGIGGVVAARALDSRRDRLERGSRPPLAGLPG
jgi:membrane associated rhomboid family serine protease